MDPATLNLLASLRQGKYTNHLQCDTLRKITSVYNNFYEASGWSLLGTAMGNGEKKLYLTECPTYTKWFSRFMRGTRLMMGEEMRQNTPLTPESLSALMKLMKEDWEVRGDEERKQVEEVACFVMASYAGGLRGEEVP